MKRKLLVSTAILSLAFTAGVFANVATQMIEVSIAPNDIYVNNTMLDADSFLYKGTTYVPIRAVSESLSLQVNFDNANNRIDINNTTNQEPQVKPTPQPEAKKSNDTTLGEQNALSKALNYLDIMAFSKEGLIKQLNYEGYSDIEAKYGADNCDADWNEQAELKAKTYIDIMSFSKQGLIEQLLYEGFTQEQAEHGAAAVGY
ncbi:MAG: Ltp family lipoprotein [Lachnospirales bacterium]